MPRGIDAVTARYVLEFLKTYGASTYVLGTESITAGVGLTGGGLLSSSPTIDLDISSLTADTAVAGTDLIPIHDGAMKYITVTNFVAGVVGTIDHDSLLNYVADQHVAHSGVDLTAGVGLTGGGTIDASRTFDLDISTLTADTSIGATDLIAIHDGAMKYITRTNFASNLALPLGGLSSNLQTQFGFFNGSFQETFDALVSSDGVTITLSLEQSGTGDLTMVFSDGFSTLDCTPAQTISLTAGTDTVPQENYLYVLQSTKALTKSTSGWPSAEHIKVAYTLVRSAASEATNGPLINQNWNDHASGTDGQGHMTHMAERSRRLGAIYRSGIASTVTIGAGSPDPIDLAYTSGSIFQMHSQTFPAFDTAAGDVLYVVNHPTTPYTQTSDLETAILTDSTGATLANRYFNLIVWCAANKGGESFSPVFVNLPDGSYATVSDASADVDSYDVYTVPDEFRLESSTGVLLYRYTFKYSGGTNNIALEATTDLRGLNQFNASGGTAGAGFVSEYSDAVFRIHDDGDATKEIAFEASSITTATTRTITVSDADITLYPSSAWGADLLPSANNTYDLGSAALAWTDVFGYNFSIVSAGTNPTFSSNANGDIIGTLGASGDFVIYRASNTTIPALEWTAQNSISADIVYGKISITLDSDALGSEDGTMTFAVAEGSSPVDQVELDRNHFGPVSGQGLNLGSSADPWNNVYFDFLTVYDYIYIDAAADGLVGQVIDISNSTGDWQFIEMGQYSNIYWSTSSDVSLVSHQHPIMIGPLTKGAGQLGIDANEIMARKVSAYGTFTVSFVNGAPDTITRASGSFITDGFEDNSYIFVSGSVSNNTPTAAGVRLVSVTALTLTLASSGTVVNEGPVSCLIHCGRPSVFYWQDYGGRIEMHDYALEVGDIITFDHYDQTPGTGSNHSMKWFSNENAGEAGTNDTIGISAKANGGAYVNGYGYDFDELEWYWETGFRVWDAGEITFGGSGVTNKPGIRGDASGNLVIRSHATGSDIEFEVGNAEFTAARLAESGGDTTFTIISAAGSTDSINLGFSADNSAASEYVFGRVTVNPTDDTAGSEDAQFELSLSVAGSLSSKTIITGTVFRPASSLLQSLGNTAYLWNGVYTDYVYTDQGASPGEFYRDKNTYVTHQMRKRWATSGSNEFWSFVPYISGAANYSKEFAFDFTKNQPTAGTAGVWIFDESPVVDYTNLYEIWHEGLTTLPGAHTASGAWTFNADVVVSGSSVDIDLVNTNTTQYSASAFRMYNSNDVDGAQHIFLTDVRSAGAPYSAADFRWRYNDGTNYVDMVTFDKDNYQLEFMASKTAATFPLVVFRQAIAANDIDPLSDDAYDLGNDSTQWRNVYVGTSVRFDQGGGNGIRFWNGSASYTIYMAQESDGSYGGSLDGTSDYNMYFVMAAGTNRGFVFSDGLANPVAQIDSTGKFWSEGGINAYQSRFKIQTGGSNEAQLLLSSLVAVSPQLYFRSWNSVSAVTNFARFSNMAADGTDGAEKGALVLDLADGVDGSLDQTFRFEPGYFRPVAAGKDLGGTAAANQWDNVYVESDVYVNAGASKVAHEYFTYLVAEEGSAPSTATASGWQFSFGNGATSSGGGPIVMVPTGYTCHAVEMSLKVGGFGTNVTVQLGLNGTALGVNYQVALTAATSGTTEFGTPQALVDGDRINFRTTTATGTPTGPCYASVLLRYTKT